MEESLDLQLFAGEGAAGGGAGEAGHPERSEGSHGDPGDLEVGGGIPPVTGAPLRNGEGQSPRDGVEDGTRNGQARSLQDGVEDGTRNGEGRSPRDGAEDGTRNGQGRSPRGAAEDGGRNGKISSLRGEDPEPERDRAAQVRNDTTDLSSALKKHFRQLEGEAEQMRQVFPGFDLRRELRDPRFAALTAPGMGVSVEDAYYALHRRELQAASMQVAARSAARKIASSIQSAARRPVENGGGSASPAGIGPQNLSKEQREALRQRIRNAAALGEKIYP